MNTTASTTESMTDESIRRRVQQDLDWSPQVDGDCIGVQARDGVITLTGCVTSFAMKLRAREAVHHVVGVSDVVDELEVRIDNPVRSDQEIAHAIRSALTWDVFVPEECIHSTVTQGWVTLEGQVPHWQQREDAAGCVERLAGVRGVTNRIAVEPAEIDAARIRSSLEEALVRRSHRGSRRLSVAVADGVVTLGGKVDSWAERQALEGLAAHCPGVRSLVNDLVIEPFA